MGGAMDECRYNVFLLWKAWMNTVTNIREGVGDKNEWKCSAEQSHQNESPPKILKHKAPGAWVQIYRMSFVEGGRGDKMNKKNNLFILDENMNENAFKCLLLETKVTKISTWNLGGGGAWV